VILISNLWSLSVTLVLARTMRYGLLFLLSCEIMFRSQMLKPIDSS
jgi:hypothetical protein